MTASTHINGPHETLPTWSVFVGDTETTGLDPQNERLCSFWFQRLDWNEDTGLWVPGFEVKSLVNPGRPIPEEASLVNGFVWDPTADREVNGKTNLAHAARFEDIARDIRLILGDTPLVFHNSVFDAAFMDNEFIRAGETELKQPLICTKQAYSEMQGLGRPHHYVKGTNLNSLSQYLGVDTSSRTGPDGKELHGAEVDGKITVQVFQKLSEMGWLVMEDIDDLPHRKPPPGLTASF